ncbi:polar amino acid transport system substrate-binding protein [Rhodopseudomonas julia]|uniref:Polar amino acid transport system substrate-binding protein n=1 Tax=Rhodopseudomonas julia TaxID=200617 RepID=A0ABU0C243_9BRAD|nr:transporter substrate-binding domain-containing protein [Rhodopseudomonas julia]MDQ0324581.1 polar amino acid transport system substrate-binding protein [Rhodopseudomonas julia]
MSPRLVGIVRSGVALIVAALIVIASGVPGRAVELSETERQWVAEHPTVTVGVVADNEPYSFFRNGSMMGWTLDVLDRIELEVGLTFVPRMGTWPEIYGNFRAGRLDVIADISLTEARLPFIAFTDPYHQRRTVIFQNVDRPLAQPIDADTLSKKRIGVITDIYFGGALRKAGIEPVEYDTYRDLMAALAFGWVDAVIASEMTGNFFARENGFSNVEAVGPVPLTGVSLEDFRLGVLKAEAEPVGGDAGDAPGGATGNAAEDVAVEAARNRDREMLHEILAKAVAALPTEELAAITERWLSYRSGRVFSAGPLRLLPEEQQFVANAPPLKVGFISDYEPLSFLRDGRGQGFAVDLMHEISAATGLAMIPVYDSAANLFEAFRAGDIDIVSNMSRTAEREDYTLFTREYHRIPNAVFVRSGFGPYRGLESLKGRKVGIGRAIYYEDALKARVADVRTYLTQEEILQALAGGEVDAAIMALSNGRAIIRRLGLINIEIGGEFLMQGVQREDLRFGVSPRYPYARSIIDRAMSAMSATRWNELETRWLGPTVAGMERQRPLLTSEERAYLDQKGVLKVCVDPLTPPYTSVDKAGDFTGVASDVMERLARQGGFSWQVVPVPIWGGGLKKAEDYECDVLPFVTDSAAADDRWTFTLPYLVLPMAVASSLNEPIVSTMNDLAGKRVGIAPGESPVRVLQERYPNVELVEVKSEAEALTGVRRGELDAALGTLPSLGYLLASKRLYDVKVAGRIFEDWRASIATRSDEPMLAAIFAKLVAGLDEQEVQTMLSRQMLVRIDQRVDYSRLLLLGGVALVVLVLVIYWNRKLRRLNAALERANQKLQDVSITDALTGLYNRRHFDARAADEFGLCQRNGWLFSVAMIDVDHFKSVNDARGHLFGDQCLRHIARLAREVFGEDGDILGRYGGEEFIIFTLGGASEDFFERLEALRRRVEKEPFSAGEETWRLTVSLGGFAAIPAPQAKLSDFVREADARLYEAKARGRNRVVGETRAEKAAGAGADATAQGRGEMEEAE